MVEPISQWPTTPAQEACPHVELVTRVDVIDRGSVRSLEIEVQCTKCGVPFHFVGVDQGLSFRRPMASADGLMLRAPIMPGKTDTQPVQTFEVRPEELTTETESSAEESEPINKDENER